MPPTMASLDFFPKTLDDLKERTAGGGLVSLCCGFLAILLFCSELSQLSRVETIDKLDVDTLTPAKDKLPMNLDIYFPALPCDELIMEVTDDSHTQQLSVTDTLHKLRMDRHGVPIDIPERVDWDHEVAPAFMQRKVVAMMEEVQSHLSDTLEEIEHEDENEPSLGEEERERHKDELAQRAALLEGRLERLVAVADADREKDDREHLSLTAQELEVMRSEVEKSRLYSDEQREHVLSNLHAMARNVERLHNESSETIIGNLREALKIRLSILHDNVEGFVSASDIDRRDRYKNIEELLMDVMNISETMEATTGQHVNATVNGIHASLKALSSGAAGSKRGAMEKQFMSQLELLQHDLRGEHAVPEGYCGSCYGASPNPTDCCNTCDDVRAAYRTKRWGFPEEANFEQCRREQRQRSARRQEGEGCNIYGTMEVARVTGIFSIAPAAKARKLSKTGRQLQFKSDEVAHFNVTHVVNRLSFGTDFPGQRNPLDAKWTYSPSGPAISRYFLKVVPTTYQFLDGTTVHTNQFSVTQYFKSLGVRESAAMVPALSFTFELTPIKVKKTEQRHYTWLAFFTRSAALIGGLFTVAGFVDTAIYESGRHLKKMQIGKAA